MPCALVIGRERQSWRIARVQSPKFAYQRDLGKARAGLFYQSKLFSKLLQGDGLRRYWKALVGVAFSPPWANVLSFGNSCGEIATSQ